MNRHSHSLAGQQTHADRTRVAGRRHNRAAPAPICYRATIPIMVLAFKDNHDAAITIPADAIVEIVGPDRDDRFMIVRSRGEEFLAFESDLKDLAQVIGPRAEC